jgi:hypothetical protein
VRRLRTAGKIVAPGRFYVSVPGVRAATLVAALACQAAKPPHLVCEVGAGGLAADQFPGWVLSALLPVRPGRAAAAGRHSSADGTVTASWTLRAKSDETEIASYRIEPPPMTPMRLSGSIAGLARQPGLRL